MTIETEIISKLQNVLLFWMWFLWIVSLVMTVVNITICSDEAYNYKSNLDWIKDNSIKFSINVLTFLGAIGITTVYLFLY